MKKLLLFIVALLATSVIGKAQLTLTIGEVQAPASTIVKVPVYITGANDLNKISMASFFVRFDTTKLTYLGVDDTPGTYFDTVAVTTFPKPTGGFYTFELHYSTWGFENPEPNMFTAALDGIECTNANLEALLPIGGGYKTRLFQLVFTYKGGGIGAINWDVANNPSEVFGPTDQVTGDITSYTLTYVNGSVGPLATLQAPVLINPLNNALNAALKPTFTWSSVASVTGYTLQVATDTLFANPVINQSITDTTYTALNSLIMNTMYYWRVGAVTAGPVTTWALHNKFTTKNIVAPSVTTAPATSITTTSAITGGVITSDGNGTLGARGIMYSDLPGVTWANKMGSVASSATTDIFPVELTGLTPTSTYYYAAYAENEVARGYGSELSFTTLTPIFKATLTTKAATGMTTTSAVLGGNITSAGNGTISERGVFVKMSAGVDSVDTKHVITGGNDFSATIGGLTPTTVYFTKAYAVNQAGTALASNEVTFTTLTPVTIPIVAIDANATNVTDMAAVVGANLTSAGNGVITERGVIVSTVAGVTMQNFQKKEINPATTSRFETTIGGLTANTTYFAKAYATNSAGTGLSSEITFTTLQVIVIPTVTTAYPTNITMNTAVAGGNVTSAGNGNILARGVIYGANPNVLADVNAIQTNDGVGVGAFVSNLSSLESNKTYYIRAYAMNEAGKGFGSEVSFQTMAQVFAPTVVTFNASGITTTSAIVAGNVTSAGNGNVSAKGILVATSAGVSFTNKIRQIDGGFGVGPFSSTLLNLTNNTTYFVKAYGLNEAGYGYGSEVSFTTLQGVVAELPTLTTLAVSNIKATTAIGGGNITKDGNAPVTERGLIWSTTAGVTMSNKLGMTTLNRTGIGSFYTSMAGLNSATTYFVKAYAKNIVGTKLGNELSFTTLATLATVATTGYSNVAQNTASVSGEVVAEGASMVVERGVVYSADANFAGMSIVASGSRLGAYTANLTGLIANTPYYAKAYATNSYGTAYGESVTFTTLQNPNLTIAIDALASPKYPYYAAGALDVLVYTLNTNFPAGNEFIAELSDAFGSFANPTIVGRTTSSVSGAIEIELPYTLVSGSQYKIQIRATNPNMVSVNTTGALIIKPIKDYLTPATRSTCSGASVEIGITNVLFEGADRYTYSWTSPALLDNSTVINPKYVNPSLGKTFTCSFIPKKAGAQITTKDVTVTITSSSVTVASNAFSIVANAVTSGNIQTLANPVVSGSTSATYTWYAGSVAPANIIADPTNVPFIVGSNVYYLVVTDAVGCSTLPKKFTVFRRAYLEGDAFLASVSGEVVMSAHPMPFEESLTLKLDANTEISNAKAKLVDLLGNVVFEQAFSGNETTLNTTNVPNGAYTLIVELNGDAIIAKTVKVK